MRSRIVTGAIVLVGVLALSMAACSGDDEPTVKASPGSTSSAGSPGASPGASAGGPRDESAVLGWTPPAPVARTEGKLAARVGEEKSPSLPATAEIISVRAGDASTILTWQLSSATDIPIHGLTLTAAHSVRDFPDAVRLIDPAGKKSYAVNTMTVGVQAYCVCSAFPRHVGPDPVRMTAEYPPVSATATSVSVRIPNFAPVTVPVTR